MQNLPLDLIAFGVLFLVGLAADQIGQRTHLPRVTLLLACGLIAGSAGFELIPPDLALLYPALAIVALSMVAFLLGSALSRDTLRAHGKAILLISLAIVVVTMGLVALGLWALGLPLAPALVLGAIATATAPAATYDVIRQSGLDNGFTRTLKGIVAIDDAWGLIAFSLMIVVAKTWVDSGNGYILSTSVIEIIGSMVLGVAVGLPAALLTGRLSDGEPLRIEALALVFMTAGLALWLELSYLIAGMTAGAVIVNLARHHTRAFHEIENIQWPFMILFFILAGATMEADVLWSIGPIGLAYVALRTLARLIGGWIGATLAGVPAPERRWYGPALLPQAGVAIGMALIAADELPGEGATIMALTLGATVVFELLGPLVAAFAIRQVAKSDQSG